MEYARTGVASFVGCAENHWNIAMLLQPRRCLGHSANGIDASNVMSTCADFFIRIVQCQFGMQACLVFAFIPSGRVGRVYDPAIQRVNYALPILLIGCNSN